MRNFTVRVAIVPDGDDALLNEHRVDVELVDEGGGPFLIIHDNQGGHARLDLEELEAVLEVGKTLVSQEGVL